MSLRKPYTLQCGDHTLQLGTATLVMGVVNVTPDSFSDGGTFLDFGQAVARGERLAAEGADIIDIGGESTRPFSDPVAPTEELARVVPVVRALSSRVHVPISIDTTKALVARHAVDAGATIINDVSALRTDPEMARVAAAYGTAVILMHMLGTPKTMQMAPAYENLIDEICAFLGQAVAHARDSGIRTSQIVVDPGIGFGKTLVHNLLLLKHLQALKVLDAPILVGSSRKAFIRKILKKPSAPEPAPRSPIVETGSQAAVAAAVLNGAHIVRVHNVADTRTTVTILDALLAADDAI